MPLPYNHKLIPRAKELRKAATRQENRLWYEFLRTYPVRFQRQKSIGNFIVDFYCFAAKLVIEIDGSQHYSDSGLQYDNERTKELEKLGLSVLRFTNSDIDNRLNDVCSLIDVTVKQQIETSV